MTEQRITLKGPLTTSTIEGVSDNECIFIRYLYWLNKYHPTDNFNFDNYVVKSENHLIACRIKAKKMGLNVI